MGISNSDLLAMFSRMERRLVSIQASILASEEDMALNFDRVYAAVEKTQGAIESIVTLVQGYAAEFRANAADQATINELADRMETEAQRAADAVTANPLPNRDPTV